MTAMMIVVVCIVVVCSCCCCCACTIGCQQGWTSSHGSHNKFSKQSQPHLHGMRRNVPQGTRSSAGGFFWSPLDTACDRS